MRRCYVTRLASVFPVLALQQVWYRNPTLSFSQDIMKPKPFIKLVDNTRDSFAYEILSVKEYKDIPLRRNLMVLVRYIIREHKYGDDKVTLY